MSNDSNGVGYVMGHFTIGKSEVPDEILELQDGLRKVFFAPVKARSYKLDGSTDKYVARFSSGPILHTEGEDPLRSNVEIDVDVTGRRYAMHCDKSVPEHLEATAEDFLRQRGYKPDTSLPAY